MNNDELRDSSGDESGSESESDISEEEQSWISWFCSIRGNEFFCEVDEDYIQDEFNLTGLSAEVPYFDYALDTILDVDSPNSEMLSEDQQETVDAAAELLYGLIHARYILTSKGLASMLEKFQEVDFGRCCRVLCDGQPLLPCGQSDVPRKFGVSLYCPRCNDIYYPKSSKHANIDGAYFGTTFPHLFLMSFPTVIPAPAPTVYVPRVFGFRVRRDIAALTSGEGGDSSAAARAAEDATGAAAEAAAMAQLSAGLAAVSLVPSATKGLPPVRAVGLAGLPAGTAPVHLGGGASGGAGAASGGAGAGGSAAAKGVAGSAAGSGSGTGSGKVFPRSDIITAAAGRGGGGGGQASPSNAAGRAGGAASSGAASAGTRGAAAAAGSAELPDPLAGGEDEETESEEEEDEEDEEEEEQQAAPAAGGRKGASARPAGSANAASAPSANAKDVSAAGGGAARGAAASGSEGVPLSLAGVLAGADDERLADGGAAAARRRLGTASADGSGSGAAGSQAAAAPSASAAGGDDGSGYAAGLLSRGRREDRKGHGATSEAERHSGSATAAAVARGADGSSSGWW